MMVEAHYKTYEGHSIDYLFDEHAMAYNNFIGLFDVYEEITARRPTDIYLSRRLYSDLMHTIACHHGQLIPIIVNDNVINILQTSYGPIRIHILTRDEISKIKTLIFVGIPKDYEMYFIDDVIEKELLLNS